MFEAPTCPAPRGIAIPLLALLSGCGGTTTGSPDAVSIDPPQIASASAPGAPAEVHPLEASQLWATPIDLARFPLIGGLARDPSGTVAVVVDATGGSSIFVVAPDGKLAWEARLDDGPGGYIHTGGVGFDAAGNLILAGQFETQLRVSGATVLEATEDTAFVLSLDARGAVRWSRALRGTKIAIPTLRVAPRGDSILVGGQFSDEITLDGTRLEGGGAGDGIDGSIFLSRLTTQGDVTWARAFPGQALLGELLDDGAGHVVFGGDFFHTIAFDGFPEMIGTDASHRGSFLVLASQDGEPRWARPIAAQGIAAASDGSLYFCGGPWKRFGRRQFTSVRPDGSPGVDRDLGLISCGGVLNGPDGRMLVHGSIAIGDPDPKSGGVTMKSKVLDVTRDGDVVTEVTLPLLETSSLSFAVPDRAGGALLGGIFKDDTTRLIVYRLSR